MIIKILGSGCKNCQRLEDNTKQALTELSCEAKVEKVSEFSEIAKFNVMKTPGLVIDDKVVSFGKVNTVDEIKEFLK
ncbi:MAG: thioredoxin family protein [Halobacteriovoraceae bacterium]|jgi:small redox-active disulfide protein 2|nr:thioredoxin family protein [Halobacteriovoraceae bacterium]